MWEVHGAERKVFDTRVTLFYTSGTPHLLPSADATTALAETALCLGHVRVLPDKEHAQLPTKHIASFGIAVPNVNVSGLHIAFSTAGGPSIH